MSDRYLQTDAGHVRFEIDRLLEAFPGLAEDEQFRADVIEGQTDVTNVIARLHCIVEEKAALAAGAREAARERTERARRFEKNSDDARSIILSILDAGNLDKLVLPFGTFSRVAPQAVVAIDSLDDLPQGFRRVKVEAAKTEIKKALMAGEDVPGARLELGAPSLAIRGA